MTMQLDKVIPWGRSKREYFAMFGLDESCLKLKILGCADGPASFNAEMTVLGGSVVSFDPIYFFSGAGIKQRFEDVAENVIEQVRATPDHWVWKFHKDPEDLRKNRRDALLWFLADFDQGKQRGRYVTAELPRLPFADRSFDLALCSHFLFLYSNLLSEKLHVQSVLEMCRVAKEVRIFPVITNAREKSPHLAAVRTAAETHGYRTEICRVDYEFQRGGNEMLRLAVTET